MNTFKTIVLSTAVRRCRYRMKNQFFRVLYQPNQDLKHSHHIAIPSDWCKRRKVTGGSTNPPDYDVNTSDGLFTKKALEDFLALPTKAPNGGFEVDGVYAYADPCDAMPMASCNPACIIVKIKGKVVSWRIPEALEHKSACQLHHAQEIERYTLTQFKQKYQCPEVFDTEEFPKAFVPMMDDVKAIDDDLKKDTR